jgi:hypothetical protein
MAQVLSVYLWKSDSSGPDDDSEAFSSIEECRNLRGVPVCSACPLFDECVLLKQYLLRRAGFRDSPGGGGSDGTGGR